MNKEWKSSGTVYMCVCILRIQDGNASFCARGGSCFNVVCQLCTKYAPNNVQWTRKCYLNKLLESNTFHS